MNKNKVLKMGKSSGGIRPNGSSSNRALEEYVSGEGMWINSWLRNGNNFHNASDRKYLNDLDRATSKSLKEMQLFRSVDASSIFEGIDSSGYDALQNVIAYGGTQKYYQKIVDDILKTKIGTIKTEKGFMSTTTSRKVAEEWGGFSGSKMPIILKINSPRGVKGADLSRHRMKQNEILLKRNLKYKIGKIYGHNGQIYVDVNILNK